MPRDLLSSHIDLVVSTVNGNGRPPPASVDEIVARSWQRSLVTYKLNPARAARPRVLTGGRLKDHQEPMQGFLSIARQGIAMLHERVREAGYLVMFTDAGGVTIDSRCDASVRREMEKLGLSVGGCWSEVEAGTNGIGTCIAEQVPITIHKSDHFCVANIDFSCTSVPVFGASGQMLGVLDVSAVRSPDDRRSQTLIMQLARACSTLIENANFLNEYRDHWVLNFNRARQFLDVQAEHLLALDHSGRIVGANRSALAELRADSTRSVLNEPIDGVFDIDAQDIPRLACEPDPPLLHTARSSVGYFASVKAPRRPAAALRRRGLQAPGEVPARPVAACASLATLAGSDAQMIRIVGQIARVVDRDIPILLTGETGTGKEMLARAIHLSSRRAHRPFVAVNCAAIPESLIESALFGYRAGAFTGAAAKGLRGSIEQASAGTLFLDEIGDMPRALQTRLLRVLAEGEVVPLGAETAVKVDLHIVCATHCDLPALVAEGAFRQDLYYRLAGLTLELPALRHRTDRAALIGQMLRAEALGFDAPVGLDADAREALLAYAWPGNIRQLRSVLRVVIALRSGDTIGLAELPAEISAALRAPGPVECAVTAAGPLPLAMTERQLAERDVLLTTLRHADWRASAAAAALQMSRATLYRKMKRLQIVSPHRAP